MSKQPFEGIRVVEFGQFVAVPVAAHLLADGGAEVIKVEALSGDPIRFVRAQGPGDSKHFISRNNGKQCLPLDLSNALAKPVIDALLGKADVVLMNLRPGLAEKLGIAPEQLIKRFPRLIIGSLSGFGTGGPEAGNAGLDLVVQARSGLMVANGRVIDGRPVSIDVAASVDTMGAMTLAFGVSAALLRREQTGEGGVITTSLLQAAMHMSGSVFCRAVERDGAEHAKLLEQLAAKRAEGAPWEEQLEAVNPVERKEQLQLSKIYYTTYATQDAFVAIACGSNPLRARFCDALGIVDEGLNPDFAGDYEMHYKTLADQVEQLMASQPSEYWVSVLRKAGVPVSKVFMPIELFDDEQIRANKMMHNFTHYSHGEITMLSPPLGLDEDGFRPGQPRGPFGSDSESILLELGFSEREIDDLMAAGISHKGI
jgi:crotonobetainyl-CoA:carnitine CoA-transferase CaiB-like acyl-CoA transferase